MHTIEITSITVIEGNGADCVLMETNLPNGCYPYNGTATVKMEVAAGTSREYIKNNFFLFPEKKIRFIKGM